MWFSSGENGEGTVAPQIVTCRPAAPDEVCPCHDALECHAPLIRQHGSLIWTTRFPDHSSRVSLFRDSGDCRYVEAITEDYGAETGGMGQNRAVFPVDSLYYQGSRPETGSPRTARTTTQSRAFGSSAAHSTKWRIVKGLGDTQASICRNFGGQSRKSWPTGPGRPFLLRWPPNQMLLPTVRSAVGRMISGREDGRLSRASLADPPRAAERRDASAARRSARPAGCRRGCARRGPGRGTPAAATARRRRRQQLRDGRCR